MKRKVVKTVSYIPIELVFWVLALIMLATAQPLEYGDINHFTLCPIANLGWHWCPGCGIGRAITQLFHGNLAESWKQHWFGIPALIIIVLRIAVLLRMKFRNDKKLKLI